ncbi:MAG: AraC family transcriptional regulator [Ruminococcaceae bacterium]|nr:AraC family transcriptional regulator [Oscillospiraceae bacterium]
MPILQTSINPNLKSISVSPKKVQLYIPPIKWRGDPKGHIGIYDTFFYIVSGECSLMIDGEYTILKPGDLAFLPRGKMRAYSNMSESIILYEMNFSAEINGEVWHGVLGLDKSPYAIKLEADDEIRELFEASVRYEVNRDILYDVIHSSNLLNLIKLYATGKARQAEKDEPFLSVIEYMKNNLGTPIKIAELAERVYMEETYFIKKFKKAFGDSPITYLNKLKIYKAMQYLAESNLTLSEISRKVGIYDGSYFSKLFKSYTSITPREYRNIFNK